jgi:hypothetical protein
VVDFNRLIVVQRKIQSDIFVPAEVIFLGRIRRRLHTPDAHLRFHAESNHRPILGTAFAPLLAGRNYNALGAKQKRREEEI